MGELAGDLAAHGVKPLREPEFLSKVGYDKTAGCKAEAMKSSIRAAVAACIRSPDIMPKLRAQGAYTVTLLDMAILAGEIGCAAELLSFKAPRSRKPVFDDFVASVSESDRLSPLTLQCGWVLRTHAVEAALRGGLDLSDLSASAVTHRQLRSGMPRLSLLDAAILGGETTTGVALAKAGVPSLLLGAKGDPLPGLLMHGDFQRNGDFALDEAAIDTAIRLGLQVERMRLDMLQIVFDYPMRTWTRSWSLLDMAICLGQDELAEKLAFLSVRRLGVLTVPSGLVEAHLLCGEVLCPLPSWKRDNRRPFPQDNASARLAAATAAAIVLDRAKVQAMPELVVLLAQWSRCWSRRGGSIQLFHCIPLRLIHVFAIPSTLLSLPQLQALLDGPHFGREGPDLKLSSNMRPCDAARAVRESLQPVCSGISV